MANRLRSIFCAVVLNAFLLIYPPGTRCLDAKFSYPPSHIFEFLQSLGPEGRAQYLIHQLVDLAFIAVYSMLILWLVRATYERNSAGKAALICLSAGLFDLVETVGILWSLWRFPEALEHLAQITAIATPLKWAALALTLLFYLFRLVKSPNPKSQF